MANWLWKDEGFRIAGNGTQALVDISAQINSIQEQNTITDLDTTGMGQSSKTRLNGLADHAYNLNGFLNSTVKGILGPIKNGTSVAKRFEHKQKASSAYTNGYVLPTSIQFSGAVDDQQLFSVTFVTSGVINQTSVALS